MTTVTVYGRPGCHLCDEATRQLEALQAQRPFVLEQVDIETDDELFKRYLERIPVIALDGTELYELFLDADDLQARLATGAPSSRLGD